MSIYSAVCRRLLGPGIVALALLPLTAQAQWREVSEADAALILIGGIANSVSTKDFWVGRMEHNDAYVTRYGNREGELPRAVLVYYKIDDGYAVTDKQDLKEDLQGRQFEYLVGRQIDFGRHGTTTIQRRPADYIAFRTDAAACVFYQQYIGGDEPQEQFVAYVCKAQQSSLTTADIDAIAGRMLFKR